MRHPPPLRIARSSRPSRARLAPVLVVVVLLRTAPAVAQPTVPSATPRGAWEAGAGRIVFGPGRRNEVTARARDTALIVRYVASRLVADSAAPYVVTATVSRAATVTALAAARARAATTSARPGARLCGGGRPTWVGSDTVLAVSAVVAPVPPDGSLQGGVPDGPTRLVLYCWGDGEGHAARFGIDRGPGAPPAERLIASGVFDLPDGARVAALLERVARAVPR